MARYSEPFKNRAVARLLPPESSVVEVVAREIGIGPGTLGRWRVHAVQRIPLGTEACCSYPSPDVWQQAEGNWTRRD